MRESSGEAITYGELAASMKEFGSWISQRCLIFILCENRIASLVGFCGAIENRIVPLLLPGTLDHGQAVDYIDAYKPSYLWLPSSQADSFDFEVVQDKYGYSMLKTDFEPYPLYDDLSLLLVTSGSTGSPKLVRHCYENINATARNVAKAFSLMDDEKALMSLPMNFTQGLSTATSNLLSGGELLLTTANMMQPEFWDLLKEATSITGVPYSYEVLCKMRFTKMNLPNLRIINEGGGKLPENRFIEIAEYAAANGKRFIASYGSTETTSRMAALPAELALEKVCSIGRPLPEGRIELVDDEGNLVPAGEVGELVYKGPNVTLGYALCKEDLAKGDERNGAYATGDMAYCDQDGCHYVVGRKSRFLKIFGFRIGLDETETLLRNEFGIECACVGTDKKMIVYVMIPADESKTTEVIATFLAEKTKLRPSSFEVRLIDDIPKNDTGKIQYRALENK